MQWAPPREAHYITEEDPGSEVAGEVAAALAATSIAFKEENATYSAELLRVCSAILRCLLCHCCTFRHLAFIYPSPISLMLCIHLNLPAVGKAAHHFQAFQLPVNADSSI